MTGMAGDNRAKWLMPTQTAARCMPRFSQAVCSRFELDVKRYVLTLGHLSDTIY